MNATQRKARAAALLALRHCGVIRVTLGQVPLGYRLLQQERLITARRAPDDPNKADVRLRPKIK
jgi:hypothetical protein